MSATATKEKSATRRETWGSLRKLPSGRWQARYPGPDGELHTARTEDDRPLTFQTKTDAPTWLSGVQTKIAHGTWESPQVLAARLRAEAEAEAEAARTIGFTEYAKRWMEMIRTQPSRSGKCAQPARSAPKRTRSPATSSPSSMTLRSEPGA